MKKTIFLITIFSLALLSCDKVENPIPDNFVTTEGIIWDDSLYIESSPSMRKIIIEEFLNGKEGQKILEIAKGHRYSLQYHEKKQETQ